MLGAGDLREIVAPVPIRSAHGEVIVRALLPVAAAEEAVLNQLGVEGERLSGQRRRRREDRVRLVLALERREEVHLVLDQRPADRAADLLVRIGQHAVGDEVLGVPLVVAEVAVDAAVVVVGARSRDRLHLDAERAALRNVEQVGDDLELGDRLAAELRLAEARPGHLLRDLLAVEIQLELPVAHARRGIDRVGGDAFDLHRQLHPVAALQRQLFHLAAIDVAGHLRGADVDERRFAGHGQRLRQRRDLHRKRQRPVLADQQLDVRHQHGRESGQLGLDFVAAGGEPAQAVFAALVRHRGHDAAGIDHRGGDGGARQRRLGAVDDGADQRRVLRERRSGEDR